MQLGMIGLGRMGGNMTRRLMRGGHEVVVYTPTAKTRDAFAKETGAVAASSLDDLVSSLKPPRAIWLRWWVQQSHCNCYSKFRSCGVASLPPRT